MKLLKLLLLVCSLILLFFTKEKSYNPYQASLFELYKTNDDYVNKWRFTDDLYPTEEVKVAQQFCIDSMGVDANDSSYIKIQKIGSFLISHLNSQLGNPNQELFLQSPWQIYQTINAGQSEFFCTQYSAMFAFFCRINNLTTREIECKGKNDRHIFNETFLPESNEWVYTDLTQKVILIKKNHQFLNFANVYHEITDVKKTMDDTCFSVEQATDTMLTLSNYRENLLFNFDSNAVFYYYYVTDLKSTQILVNKLKSYFLNQPYFRVYSHRTFFPFWYLIKYYLLANMLWLVPSLFFSKKKK